MRQLLTSKASAHRLLGSGMIFAGLVFICFALGHSLFTKMECSKIEKLNYALVQQWPDMLKYFSSLKTSCDLAKAWLALSITTCAFCVPYVTCIGCSHLNNCPDFISRHYVKIAKLGGACCIFLGVLSLLLCVLVYILAPKHLAHFGSFTPVVSSDYYVVDPVITGLGVLGVIVGVGAIVVESHYVGFAR